MGWAMQDPQPALAAGPDAEELQSTVVPFSLDKRPEGRRLIYSGRYSSVRCSAALCARCIVCAGLPALKATRAGQVDGRRSCSMNAFSVLMASACGLLRFCVVGTMCMCCSEVDVLQVWSCQADGGGG